jgi:hypothetical protein
MKPKDFFHRHYLLWCPSPPKQSVQWNSRDLADHLRGTATAICPEATSLWFVVCCADQTTPIQEPMKMRPITSVASKYPRLFAIVNFSSPLLTVSLLMTSACGGEAAGNSRAILQPVITVAEHPRIRSRYPRRVGPAPAPVPFVITICAMTVGSNTPLPECVGETPQTPCATDDGWMFRGGDQAQFGVLLEGVCTVVGPDGPETIRLFAKNRDIAH